MIRTSKATILTALMLSGLLATAGQAATIPTVTDFSNGAEGWRGFGPTFVDASLGNEAPALHTPLFENFGVQWVNDSNPAFIGDFSVVPSLTVSLDARTFTITSGGAEVTRNLILEFVDYGATSAETARVWYNLGTLDASKDFWETLSVTIADTSATALPAGWGGVDGDGNLQLPDGRTFASVLANVDELRFTTFEPGFFYGFTFFDVALDNIAITGGTAAVPEPASWALMIGGFGLIGAAARRRRARPA